MRKMVVIYYDGNEFRAKYVETDAYPPDMTMPEMFNLPEDCDITALVEVSGRDALVVLDGREVVDL